MADAKNYPTTQEEQEIVLREQASKCYQLMKNFFETNGEKSAGICDPIWDGMMCWNATKPGIVQHPCPSYVAGSYTNMFAYKECLVNGIWYKQNNSELESWTNFSQCFPKDQATLIIDVEMQDTKHYEPYMGPLKNISEVGYSFSLVSLLVAFTILISFKKLRCSRNKLHLHLFASFILRAFMALLKDSLFVDGLAMSTNIVKNDEGVPEFYHKQDQTLWPCRMIIVLWQYFLMANYSWILMEGLYLHNLIFLALFTDSSSITLYCFLGWGLPLIFVLPWTVCKAMLENTFCWTLNDNIKVFLLIQGPTTATVVINFILFINIIRVLLRKLQSSVSEETKTFRRWAKSTLVLIPLFGIHYMVLLGLQYTSNYMVELVWLFTDRIFTCFNGFLVALLYCFLNGEVRNELARKWEYFSFRDLLERYHLAGHNSIFSTLLGNERHRRPRGSCYSSASCTLDSYVHSNTRDKKRNLIAHTTPVQGTQLISGKKDIRVVTTCGIEPSAVEDGLSNIGKDRRWSTSDCDLENNALELKSITSPGGIVNL